jgi:hypothetical protein
LARNIPLKGRNYQSFLKVLHLRGGGGGCSLSQVRKIKEEIDLFLLKIERNMI